ncbi:hypothetical protein P0O24_12005 [Methanotrichaceae archaeon M04Ac]|uniref:Uncharacterized protein n=1 Tax=Candidatus Methanocrinis alkalitolerans TaxID=3033395 RepID=A0ABT5XHV5_9EURY|nr:hypothetical protein [Candidatus Methanocrinis alkalitolerans]MDF0594303.1 hypothetical protein [Candidatus Methanocrinis alkalitolerans]
MVKTIPHILLAAIILGAILITISDAKIGYDVTARVNSTSWSVNRSTQNLNFEMSGSISGNGSFSKLTHIQNFAGIESRELSSSSAGQLNYDELMQLQSLEGPVSIVAKLKSGTNESINESVNIRDPQNDFINLEIDERWPTRFSNYKKISYLGPGIRTRESYQNNRDVVSTSIDSWKLYKESIYQAHINRSVTSVEITSDDLSENTFANKSSRYGLNLVTIGSSTNLDVIRLDESGAPKLLISQDYLGEHRMNLNVTMNDWVSPPEGEPKQWLDCCGADDSEEATKCPLTPSLERFVFDS